MKVLTEINPPASYFLAHPTPLRSRYSISRFCNSANNGTRMHSESKGLTLSTSCYVESTGA
jgi:hypothetical protein